MRSRTERTPFRLGAVTGLVLVALAAGCAVTQRAQVTDQNYCPFLGNAVCSQLTPSTDKNQADLRYLNPNAQWTQYNKVLIEPVTFWGDDSSKLSAADQRTLANYVRQALEQQLSAKFQVVNQAGPGVMALQVAIIDATTATPGLRSISVIEPHAYALAVLKYMATGSFPFVGSVESAFKISDAVTGQVLAASVTKRIGGGSPTNVDVWEWGDAENAITHWAQMVATRLSSWTSGTAPS